MYTAGIVLLVYVRILSFLRGFKSTAVLVLLLVEVAVDICPFCIILSTMLFAFASCIYVVGEFKTPSQALFATVNMAMGESYLDDDYRFSDTAFVQILFVTFSVAVVIVMLNLLIAIIGDSHERVVESADRLYWMEKWKMCREQEKLLLHLDRTVRCVWGLRITHPSQHNSKWLHVLTLANTSSDSTFQSREAWTGRVKHVTNHIDKALKNRIDDEQVGKVNAKVDDVKAQVDDVNAKVDDVKAQVDAKFDEINAKVDAKFDEINAKVDAKFDEILKLLANQQ
jgi:hypothetical protein